VGRGADLARAALEQLGRAPAGLPPPGPEREAARHAVAAQIKGPHPRGLSPAAIAGQPELPGEAAERARQGAALGLRMAPGLVTAPTLAIPGGAVIPSLASAGGEAAAQLVESGEITSPGQIGLAAAVPPLLTAPVRGARALGTMAKRLSGPRFERAHGKAQKAGEELVRRLRPQGQETVGQLSEAARAAGGDLIQTPNVQKLLLQLHFPGKPIRRGAEDVATAIDNLKGVTKPTGEIPLGELETIRKDIGGALHGAPPELRALYGAILKDLDAAGRAGSVGATLAREAATAAKAEFGAAKISDLLAQSTKFRVVNGADVPALNIATFRQLTRKPENRKELLANIGPDGMRAIDGFIHKFRGLPPDMAYTAWNKMMMTIAAVGGGVAGTTGGGPAAAAIGPMVGAIAPELLVSLNQVGANPRLLNRVLVTVGQGLRASTPEQQYLDEVRRLSGRPVAGPSSAPR
jgi:hypothetical protein